MHEKFENLFPRESRNIGNIFLWLSNILLFRIFIRTPSSNITKNASPNNTLSYAKMYKDARLDIFPPRVSLFFPLVFFENLLLL